MVGEGRARKSISIVDRNSYFVRLDEVLTTLLDHSLNSNGIDSLHAVVRFKES